MVIFSRSADRSSASDGRCRRFGAYRFDPRPDFHDPPRVVVWYGVTRFDRPSGTPHTRSAMNQTHPHAPPAVLDACDRFTASWLAGSSPDPADFLPPDEPARSAAVVELCERDLRFGLRAG